MDRQLEDCLHIFPRRKVYQQNFVLGGTFAGKGTRQKRCHSALDMCFLIWRQHVGMVSIPVVPDCSLEGMPS